MNATALAIPDQLKDVNVVKVDSPYGSAYTASELKPGFVRVNRHTHKYLLGDTLFSLGKIDVSPEETVSPEVHVYGIYEISTRTPLNQGAHIEEEWFTRVRYYASEQMAAWAFKELQENKGTIQTLSPNFRGRDAMEMKAFLLKNYVHK